MNDRHKSIVSKIGDFDSYGSDPSRIEYAGANTDGISVDYKRKYSEQQLAVKENYATFDMPYNGTDNETTQPRIPKICILRR